MSFADDWADVVGPHLERLGLLRIRACEDARQVIYAMRADEDVGVYLLARDARPVDGEVDCEYLIAPLDIPDDRVRNCWVGLRAILYRDYAFDDGIASGVAKRAATLHAAREAFVARVGAEFASPPIPSPRLQLLATLRKLLADVRAKPTLQADWSKALRRLRSEFGGRFDDAEAMQSAIADQVSRITAALAKERNGLRGVDRDVAQVLLSERAIMLSLGPTAGERP